MNRTIDTTSSPGATIETSRPSVSAPTTGATVPYPARWEGRAFGAIVLAAFLLYGVGSTIADRPVGLALVLANSFAVACAGLIGFRLVRSADRGVGVGYLGSRGAEAICLAGGILLAEPGDVGGAADVGYLLGMLVLSIGSIPFFMTLRRRRLVPPLLAMWGVCGYGALAVGAAVELATGRSVAVVFAVPGGLFELALGCYLLRHGVRRATAPDRLRQAGA
ncbi:MAG: DUF4386 family protein [Nocardioidaceae bacterium]|nr:DUF4386 family protein [Nocardioidaceae bacterium]